MYKDTEKTKTKQKMSRKHRTTNRKAVDKTLKDYGSYAVRKNGDIRKGYAQLADNRIVRESDLEKETIVEEKTA